MNNSNLNPPFTNRGVEFTYNNNINLKNELLCHIDWYSGTASNIKYDEWHRPYGPESIAFIEKMLVLCKAQKPYNSDDLITGARYGYKLYYCIQEGIQIRFCGPKNSKDVETWNLEITGRGCDFFDKDSWFKLMDFLYSTCDWKPTRIDLPSDDLYGKQFTMKSLYNIIFEEKRVRYRQGIHSATFYGSSDLKNNSGFTYYIGSRYSDFFCRIYDKKAEQLEKCGFFEKTHNQWVRYELVFKNDYAVEVGMSLYESFINNDNISKIWASWIKELFNICLPSDDTNTSRWTIDPLFNEFIEDFKDINFSRMNNKNSSLVLTKKWLENSAMKGLLKIILAKGTKYFKLWLRNSLSNILPNLKAIDYIHINNIRHESFNNDIESNEILNIINQLNLNKEESDYINSFPDGWPNKEILKNRESK